MLVLLGTQLSGYLTDERMADLARMRKEAEEGGRSTGPAVVTETFSKNLLKERALAWVAGAMLARKDPRGPRLLEETLGRIAAAEEPARDVAHLWVAEALAGTASFEIALEMLERIGRRDVKADGLVRVAEFLARYGDERTCETASKAWDVAAMTYMGEELSLVRWRIVDILLRIGEFRRALEVALDQTGDDEHVLFSARRVACGDVEVAHENKVLSDKHPLAQKERTSVVGRNAGMLYKVAGALKKAGMTRLPELAELGVTSVEEIVALADKASAAGLTALGAPERYIVELTEESRFLNLDDRRDLEGAVARAVKVWSEEGDDNLMVDVAKTVARRGDLNRGWKMTVDAADRVDSRPEQMDGFAAVAQYLNLPDPVKRRMDFVSALMGPAKV